MFNKKQLDRYFSFAFSDAAAGLAYWEEQQQNGDNKTAPGAIKALEATRDFLELSRKNIMQVGKDKYQLVINSSHPDKKYIYDSIQLATSIVAFGCIRFITTNQPTNDREELPTDLNELAEEIEDAKTDPNVTSDPASD